MSYLSKFEGINSAELIVQLFHCKNYNFSCHIVILHKSYPNVIVICIVHVHVRIFQITFMIV